MIFELVGIDVRCEVVHYPYPPLRWGFEGLETSRTSNVCQLSVNASKRAVSAAAVTGVLKVPEGKTKVGHEKRKGRQATAPQTRAGRGTRVSQRACEG